MLILIIVDDEAGELSAEVVLVVVDDNLPVGKFSLSPVM